MDEELGVDDHVAEENDDRVEDPATETDNKHGGDVPVQIRARDD